MTLARNILAVVIGLLLGGAVNMGIIMIGPQVIPPPAGVNVSDGESIAAAIDLFEPKHFIVPFLAHALGTLSGALVAFLIAASYRISIALVIGAAFLGGGISVAMMIPAPIWFIVIDLVFAYLPMAWLGILAGRCCTPARGDKAT